MVAANIPIDATAKFTKKLDEVDAKLEGITDYLNQFLDSYGTELRLTCSFAIQSVAVAASCAAFEVKTQKLLFETLSGKEINHG